MNNLPYTAGTVSIPAGSATATGSGVVWTDARVQPWGFLWVPDTGQVFGIASIDSATGLTLVNKNGGADITGAAYTIISFPSEMQDSLNIQAIRAFLATASMTIYRTTAPSAGDGIDGTACIVNDGTNPLTVWTKAAGAWTQRVVGTSSTGITDATTVGKALLTAASAAAARSAVGVTSQAEQDARYLGDNGLPWRLSMSCGVVSDWNAATANGWYMGAEAAHGPPGFVGWALGEVIVHIPGAYCTQTVHSFLEASSANSKVMRRHQSAGVFGDWYTLQLAQYEQDLRYARLGATNIFTDNQVISKASNPAFTLRYPAVGDLTMYLGADGAFRILQGDQLFFLATSGAVTTKELGDLKTYIDLQRARSFTIATKPSAATAGAGAVIYISDVSGGAVMAFSDGTAWRKFSDRTVIA